MSDPPEAVADGLATSHGQQELPNNNAQNTTSATDFIAKYARPPKPLELGSNKAESWKMFERQWRNYSKLSRLTEKSQDIQVTMLEMYLGEEALRIYDGLHFDTPASERTMEEILEAMKAYAVGFENESYERFIFRSRTQDENEPFSDYLAALRKLALTCNFCKGCFDAEIRDQIVFGIRCSDTREDLLKINPLSLKDCIDICRAAESAVHQGKMYQQTVSTGKVNKLSHAREQWKTEKNPSKSKKTEERKCKFCAGSHEFKKELCPAWGKICGNCRKPNHLPACCYKKSTRKVNNVTEASGSDSDTEWINLVSKSDNKEYKVRFSTNGQDIVFQIDSGASVNLLPEWLAKPCKIRPQPVRLQTWNQATINTIGKCRQTIVNPKNGHKYSVDFVVYTGDHQPVLGLSTSIQMGLLEIRESDFERINLLKLDEFSEVFEETLGKLPGKQSLHVKPDAIPLAMPDRRIPISIRPQVDEELDRLTKLGVITPVTEPTPWVSQLVIAKKKDGRLRICLDPHELNKGLQREKYTLPILEDTLAQLQGSVFTKADLSSAFWQVELDTESSLLTTFQTHRGRYRWLRLPFGLNVSSEILQKKLSQALEGLPGVSFMADDVVIFGKSSEEHDENLHGFLSRCKQVGIKLNRQKMELRTPSITFMGHVISAKGVSVDPEKVKAITEIKTPCNLAELRTYLGMVNYVGKFCPMLADKVAVMQNLMKKDVEWHWTAAHQKAFEETKDLVCSAPVLALYDQHKPLALETDASEYGLGAALMQEGRPIAYASRLLSAAERNYHPIEKEMMAIVFGLKRFHHYAYGRELLVITDHQPLVGITKKPLHKASKRLQAMQLKLQEYSFSVTYRPGSQNDLADGLSRNPVDHPILSETIYVVTTNPFSDARLEEVRKATAEDPALHQLADTVAKGWPETRKEVHESLLPYFSYRDELSIEDGIIYRGERVVIPKQMRLNIMKRTHMGHLGINSALRRAREALFWPGMSNDIRHHVESCDACATYANKQHQETPVMSGVPEQPWMRIAVDLFSWAGKEYLVTTDYHSGYYEFDKLQTTTSEAVIGVIKSHCARFGVPGTIVSDNGPQFSSKEFRIFTQKWSIVHERISPGNSQANGAAEVAVRAAKRLLRKSEHAGEDIFESLLNIRNTKTEGSDTSPAERLLGRPTQTLIPTRRYHGYEFSKREAEKKQDARQNKLLRKHAGKDLPQLRVGDHVRVQPIDGSKKWKEATITKQLSGRSFETSDGLRRNRRMLRRGPSPEHSFAGGSTTQHHRGAPFPTQAQAPPPPQDPPPLDSLHPTRGSEEPGHQAALAPPHEASPLPSTNPDAEGPGIHTRSGRAVKKPARFR